MSTHSPLSGERGCSGSGARELSDIVTAADERWARVAWSWIAEPADAPSSALVAEHGVLSGLAAVLNGTAGTTRAYLERAATFSRARLAEAHRRLGVGVLIPGDEDWPERLNTLAQPPYVLYTRGSGRLAELVERSVAIVGSRACSDYGARVAAELAEGLTGRCFTVVSGGAFGIDIAAHRGALAAGAPTIAVLACGLDRVYPQAHEAVFRRICQDGLLVGELPLGYAPFPSRFLARNRLISALTSGTVVVEANLRSGSLSTARHARDQCRPVGVVPGPVTSPTSAGCHELIREGDQLVTDAADVAELCGRIGHDAAPRRQGELRQLDRLRPEVRAVLLAIPVRSAASVDDIIRVSGVSGQPVLRALAELDVDGYVERAPDGWRRLPPSRDR